LCWTTLSTRKLAAELTAAGHKVGPDTVARLLRESGFSLQANAKTLEGGQHPDRDGQFSYLNDQAGEHLADGQPVISVDTKKKELVGPYKNGGAEWRPAGQPEKVKVHDFLDPTLGKANPYGVYDLGADTGWVAVGTDHDTAAFAVQTIRGWWQSAGTVTYPGATRLLITADGGGSNGYCTRLWKTELAALAEQTGVTITVCHLPRGTLKWNKIEHRLFSHISMNWRGRPDQPRGHHRIHRRDHHPHRAHRPRRTRHRHLPGRRQDPDAQMKALHDTGVHRHDWHPEWNYTFNPHPK